MYFEMTCPCGQRFRVAESNRGRKVRCPECGNAHATPPSVQAGTLPGPRREQSHGQKRPSGIRSILLTAFVISVVGASGAIVTQRPRFAAWWETFSREAERARERSDRYGKLLDQGQAALRDRHHDRAIAAFRAARDLCASGDARRSEAERALEQAEKARGDEFEACQEEGRDALLKHDFDRADGAFHRALALFEGQSDAKERVQAEAALREVRDRRANAMTYASLVSEGDAAVGRHEYPAAFAAYDKALGLFPDDPAASRKGEDARVARDRFRRDQVAEGLAASNARSWEAAESALGRAVKAGGDIAEAESLLAKARKALAAELTAAGRASLAANRTAEAVSQLERARSLTPHSPDLEALWSEADYRDQVRRGWGCLDRSNYRQVPGHAERALAIRPGDASAERLRWEATTALEHGEVSRFHGHGVDVADLAFEPSSDQLVVSYVDGAVEAWNLALKPGSPPAFTSPPREGGSVVAVALASEGKKFAWAFDNGRVRIAPTDPGDDPGRKVLGVLNPVAGVSRLALSPDGTTLAAGNAGGEVVAWSLAPLPVERFHTPRGARSRKVTALALSGDGKILAVGYDSGNSELLDAQTGRIRHVLNASGMEQQAAVTALTFAPNGMTVVSARSNGIVSAWLVTNGRRGERKQPHLGPVTDVAFSPSGFHFISTSDDGTIHAVSHTDGDATHRDSRTVPALHAGPISAVGFDRTSGRFATAGRDGLIKLWPVASAKPDATR